MPTPMERTLVLVKPDGVQRGIAGEVITRLERRGLKLVAMRMLKMDRALAERHYESLKDKSFFNDLVAFMTSRPIVAMVWEGENAVRLVRDTMGATDPVKAAPGTIRAEFATDIGRNVIHGSDSVETAGREVSIFFKPEEVLSYERETDRWITGP